MSDDKEKGGPGENDKKFQDSNITNEIDDTKKEIEKKDSKMNEEIDKAKDKTGKIEHNFTDSVSPKLSAVEKVAIFTSIGTGLIAIADLIRTNPFLTQLAVAGAGVILASPVGQPIVIAIALGAVAYYAYLAVKAKFQGLYTVLRTLDEFTILLEKIQRMIRVTVFISGTYKFQINVDEINNQLKIILKRFEETLKDVEINEIKSKVSDAQNLKNLSINTSNSAAQASQGEVGEAEQEKNQNDKNNNQNTGNNQNIGGRRRIYQAGGNYFNNLYKKFTFPVEKWNRNLLDDVTKLNIRLTTAMGEFTIILNVIQMNMIADGFNALKPTTSEKIDAVDKFVKHTTDVKESSEYKKMRIGILINDILSLRVDFEFCNQGKSGSTFGTQPNDDPICLEYTRTDTAGNRLMIFREELHKMIILLCQNLMEGEGYDKHFKNVVKINVIDPYIKLLENAKFDSEESKSTIAETLKRLNLKESNLIGDDKNEINQKLQNLSDSTNNIVQVGGLFSWNKSTTTTEAAAKNIINYLKEHPVNIISNSALKLYLDNVYKFSKEITKPSEEEKDQTKQNLGNSTQQGSVNKQPNGGTRRNKKRRNSKKYTKSSSAIKRSKTYKIRI